MATVVELPESGEPVALTPSAGERMISRVEDSGRDAMVLTPPIIGGREVRIRDGTPLSIEWVTARGLARAPARAQVHKGDTSLLVSIVGEPELFQRREYVRAKSALAIGITLRGTKITVSGMTIDVSGGGVRAQAKATDLPVGANVDVRIDLPDEPLEAQAMVLRHQGLLAVVLQFTEIEDNERQRLIRHVFERLRASVRNW